MTLAFPTLKRTKVSSGLLALAAAIGLVVAIGGAVAVSTSSDGGSGSGTATAERRLIMEQPHPTYVMYLVGSQEQADYIQWGLNEAARERESAGIADPGETVMILKASTPEEEAYANEVLNLWYEGQPNAVYVFDKR
jgi:hypothetical protein